MGEGERKTERSPIDYLDSRTGEMRKKACSKNSSTNR